MSQMNNPYEAPQSPFTAVNSTATNLASKGQRFGTYCIDTIAIYVLLFVGALLGGMLGFSADSAAPTILFIVLFLGYFIYLELTFGQTLGKMLMKTKVITEDGSPLTLGKVLGRTACRFIPFEAFSTFGTQPWHDSIPKTRVISTK